MRKYLFILFLFITTLSYGQTYYGMGSPIWQRTPTSKGWFLRIDAATFGKYNFYTAPQLDSLFGLLPPPGAAKLNSDTLKQHGYVPQWQLVNQLALKANLSGGNNFSGLQVSAGNIDVLYGAGYGLQNPANNAATLIKSDGLVNGNHIQILQSKDDTIADKGNFLPIYFNGMSGNGTSGNPLTPITTNAITLNSTVPVQSGAVYNALLNYPTISVANATYAPIGINGTVTNVSSSTGAITITNSAIAPILTFNPTFAFNFTGANSIGNSWTLNSNNSISFGNTTNNFAALYSRILSSNSTMTFNTSSGNSFLWTLNGAQWMRLSGSGNLLIGNPQPTENFTDIVQLGGSILATDLKASNLTSGKILASSSTSIVEATGTGYVKLASGSPSYVTTIPKTDMDTSSITGVLPKSDFSTLGNTFYYGKIASDARYAPISVAGTVTNVTSANSDIGIATGTTTPVLTFNRAGTYTWGGANTYSVNALFNAGLTINPSFVLQWGSSGNFGTISPTSLTGVRNWLWPDASGTVAMTNTSLQLTGGTVTGPVLFTNSITSNSIIVLGAYTVATLPASPGVGATAYVTDALAPGFLTIIVGGGSTKSPVFFNGTNWVSY